MNDKERLEEIKESLCEIEAKIEEGKREDVETINEKIIGLYLDNHIDWLIQQAKRVEELQKVNAELSFELGKRKRALEKKHITNKRYRETLEKIANHETYGIDIVSHEFRMSDVGELARGALEGETDE